MATEKNIRKSASKKPKEIALYVEQILHDEADPAFSQRLDNHSIIERLKTRYQVSIGRDALRSLLSDMQFGLKQIAIQQQQDSVPDKTSSSYRSYDQELLIAKNTGSNCRNYYSLTHQVTAEQIEYLLRIIQITSAPKSKQGSQRDPGAQLTRFLLAQASDKGREQILANIPDGPVSFGKTKAIDLGKLLNNLSMLQNAIEQHCECAFTYRDNKERDRITPHLIAFNDGYYHLVTRRSGKSCTIYRIDLIDNIHLLTGLREDDGEFAKNVKVADNYIRASVNRMSSSRVVKVHLVCHNPNKARFAVSEFSNNPEYSRDIDGQHFHFKASFEGMKLWAVKWMDAFEVLEPLELRDEIIDFIQTKSCYGKFERVDTKR